MFYVRFGFSPAWRDIAGSTTCRSTISCANAFYDPHFAPILWGYMDGKHSWLHPCQLMACNGCWLPHHPSHYLSAQLWPFHNMDGLDLWHSSWPLGWWIQEGHVMLPDFSFRHSNFDILICIVFFACKVLVLANPCTRFLIKSYGKFVGHNGMYWMDYILSSLQNGPSQNVYLCWAYRF
jgi:hypothetical protein